MTETELIAMPSMFLAPNCNQVNEALQSLCFIRHNTQCRKLKCQCYIKKIGKYHIFPRTYKEQHGVWLIGIFLH